MIVTTYKIWIQIVNISNIVVLTVANPPHGAPVRPPWGWWKSYVSVPQPTRHRIYFVNQNTNGSISRSTRLQGTFVLRVFFFKFSYAMPYLFESKLRWLAKVVIEFLSKYWHRDPTLAFYRSYRSAVGTATLHLHSIGRAGLRLASRPYTWHRDPTGRAGPRTRYTTLTFYRSCRNPRPYNSRSTGRARPATLHLRSTGRAGCSWHRDPALAALQLLHPKLHYAHTTINDGATFKFR